MSNLSYADLVAPATKRDAIAVYSHLRTLQGPLEIANHPRGIRHWLVADYDTANAVLQDQRFAKDIFRALPLAAIEKFIPNIDLFQHINTHMLGKDLLDHSRLRLLVSKAFTPRLLEQQRTYIQGITNNLLDRVQAGRHMDLIKDFAYPLPVAVISEMLGVPEKDREKFRYWSEATIGNQGLFQNMATQQDALTEFVQFMQSLIVLKRTEPADDLLSNLVQIDEQGDKLSEKELTSMILLLIIAGHETTVNLIGNGTLALLEHPDQLQTLRDHPELLPNAIEELLRYTAPVIQTTTYWVSEDLELNGKQLKRGDALLISPLAADLDPLRFPDPEHLDITRKKNAHLAFGKGIHYCLGAPLARMEGQIAISTLLRRLPELRLAVAAEDLEWSASMIMRGLRSLPVVWETQRIDQ